MDDVEKHLCEIVRRNDFMELESMLLSSKKKLLSASDLGKALKLAADEGNAKCVQVLLDAGAPADTQDGEGMTALTAAASKGRTVIVILLLKSGASVDKATFRLKATALHWAATYGHLECVKRLVDGGASLSVQTVSGRTPLMLAARADHRDIVEFLIAAGSDVNVLDNENATVIHLVAEEGHVRCARILLPLADDFDASMKNGETPLKRAVKRGQTEMVKLLTRWQCDLGGSGLSAIHWAAERGHPECVTVLLRAGANPNCVTEELYRTGPFLFTGGVSPLMLAAKNGHETALLVLVRAGAAVDAVDGDGRTALLYAIKHNHPRCLVALIAAGADPDGVPYLDTDGSTEPQQGGSQGGQDDEHDTSDETESSDERDDDSDSEESTNNLNERNNYDRNQLLDLEDQSSGDNDNDHDGTPEETSGNTRPAPPKKTMGISPLFLAIKENHKDCVKILLKSGCNLDMVAEADDGQYVGPFEFALVGGFISTAKMLLACGLTRNNVNRMLLTMAFEALLAADDLPGGISAVAASGEVAYCTGAELVDWFLDHLRVAPSLMSLSRKAIRNALGRKVVGAVPELQLPKRLEDFVALKELDEY